MSYIFERITQRLSAKKYNSLWIKRLRPTSEITRKLRLVSWLQGHCSNDQYIPFTRDDLCPEGDDMRPDCSIVTGQGIHNLLLIIKCIARQRAWPVFDWLSLQIPDLLDRSVEFNKFNLIQHAIYDNDIQLIKRLVNPNDLLSYQTKYGQPLLHFAVGVGHLEMVQWLVDQAPSLLARLS